MLESALRPEWDGAVRVGVASHNLFDVAWALVTRGRLAVDQRARIELEMLEGMAPAQSRAVRKMAGALAAVRAGRAARPDRRQHRLPRAAARREHRARELPARPVHDHAGLGRVRRAGRAVPPIRCRACTRSRRHDGDSPALPHGSRRSRNEPDSDPTDHDVRERLRAAVRTAPDAHRTDARRRPSTRSTRSSRRRSSPQPTLVASRASRRVVEMLAAVADVLRRERFDTIQVMADEAVEGRPRGRPRGQRGDRLRHVLRHRSASTCSSNNEPRARRCRRVVSSSWRRRGTSRTRFRPAACWPRSPPATR